MNKLIHKAAFVNLKEKNYAIFMETAQTSEGSGSVLEHQNLCIDKIDEII